MRAASAAAAALLLLVVAMGCAEADRALKAANTLELLGAKADARRAFASWCAKYQKGYSNDLKEYERRFRAFVDNMAFIEEYNAKHTSHWLGLNALADLTHGEFKAKYGLGVARYARPPASSTSAASNRASPFTHGALDAASLPPAVDWRKKGAVAEVKNQQQCGSCWAFSTTGSIEGVNAIATGEVVSLSEQELVDCDTKKDKGCSGGLMDFAFEYVAKEGRGLHTEADYPYTGADGECQREQLLAAGGHRVVTIDGFEDVPPRDEVALKKAVSQQPVSVAIEADQRAFQLYVGGVFDDEECGEQLDHGVLAVGYGVEAAPPPHGGDSGDDSGDSGDDDSDDPLDQGRFRNYWIVKNSWGPGWGDNGFIKLRMGRGKAGLCGIAMQPSYPLKRSPNPPTPPPAPGPKPGPHPGPGPQPGPTPPPTPPTPPTPSPEPVACDTTSECPPATTCCCLKDMAGFCFTWGCCPMAGATCCADKEHCCPSDLPVCDTDEGRCLPKPAAAGFKGGAGGYAASVPWATKLPASPRGTYAAAAGEAGEERREEPRAAFRPSTAKWGQQARVIAARPAAT